MKQIDWTPGAHDELKRLWLDGQTARQIGTALGRSRNSVIGKINRMGLSSPDPKKIANQKAVMLGFFAAPAPRGCQFIAGDPLTDASVCGNATAPGSSYCAHHHAICYRPAKEEAA